MLDEMDYTHENEIVCPYCGEKENDSWEAEDDGEIECDCGETFEFVRNIEITYSSYPKKTREV